MFFASFKICCCNSFGNLFKNIFKNIRSLTVSSLIFSSYVGKPPREGAQGADSSMTRAARDPKYYDKAASNSNSNNNNGFKNFIVGPISIVARGPRKAFGRPVYKNRNTKGHQD